jgi:hypothetical protein
MQTGRWYEGNGEEGGGGKRYSTAEHIPGGGHAFKVVPCLLQRPGEVGRGRAESQVRRGPSQQSVGFRQGEGMG